MIMAFPWSDYVMGYVYGLIIGLATVFFNKYFATRRDNIFVLKTKEEVANENQNESKPAIEKEIPEETISCDGLTCNKLNCQEDEKLTGRNNRRLVTVKPEAKKVYNFIEKKSVSKVVSVYFATEYGNTEVLN